MELLDDTMIIAINSETEYWAKIELIKQCLIHDWDLAFGAEECLDNFAAENACMAYELEDREVALECMEIYEFIVENHNTIIKIMNDYIKENLDEIMAKHKERWENVK